MRVGVVIPTYRARKELPFVLPFLFASPLKPTILIIDSSSTDGTVDYAKEMGCVTLVIPKEEFNHGLTREKARRHIEAEIAVFLTQDARPLDQSLLEKLVEPIVQGKASIAYARQVPKEGAGIFEAFLREFNYPDVSHLRGLKEARRYGATTFFCSNSCSAFSTKALDEVGGFPRVLIGEDTAVTAKLLHKSHKIAYVAEAVVRHSHAYSLKQEFQHYFDTSVARREYASLIDLGGSDAARGLLFAKGLIKKVVRKKPYLLPYTLLHITAKWLGFAMGRLAHALPLWVKKRLSAQKAYWANS